MRLSTLQKQLVLLCLDRAGKCGRQVLDSVYERDHTSASRKTAQNVVTSALENLIDKGFMVGEAVRTPKKWYIKAVRLSPLGRKLARELRGKQLRMKFTL